MLDSMYIATELEPRKIDLCIQYINSRTWRDTMELLQYIGSRSVAYLKVKLTIEQRADLPG
jgi:hypothetical protein